MAAGFSTLVGHIPGISDTKLVGRMLIGGIASKLGGGEFANGALSAAFEYLYNYGGDGGLHSIVGLYDSGSVGVTYAGLASSGQIDVSSGCYSSCGLTSAYLQGIADLPWQVASLYGPGRIAEGAVSTYRAMGPMKQWIRFGSSHSKVGGFDVALSLRWGASPIGNGKYLKQIPSQEMRDINQQMRNIRIPLAGWRTADSGHLHLLRNLPSPWR
jgi:hypothetical protein